MTKQVIDFDWINTDGAKDYVNALYSKNGKRKQFGLLEKPSLKPDQPISYVKYKLFLCGKTCTGKTSTLANLLGQDTENIYPNTPGMNIGRVYWPVRIVSTGKILYLDLQFWDAGDQACKTFEHVVPACMESVDCLLLCFSMTDRSSFNDIVATSNQLCSVASKGPLKVVVATKIDQCIKSDISDEEIVQVSEQIEAYALKICNVLDKNRFEEITYFLNNLSNYLILRDENVRLEKTTE